MKRSVRKSKTNRRLRREPRERKQNRSRRRSLVIEGLEDRRLLAEVTEGFTMVFAGDPQYYRALRAEFGFEIALTQEEIDANKTVPGPRVACAHPDIAPATTSDPDNTGSEYRLAKCKEVARSANKDTVSAIKKIDTIRWPSQSPDLTEGTNAVIPKPQGVIVNGDLTESFFPSQIYQYLTNYEEGIENEGIPVYAGAGNHDFDVSLQSSKEGAWYMADQVGRIMESPLHESVTGADVPGYVILDLVGTSEVWVTLNAGSQSYNGTYLVSNITPFYTRALPIPPDIENASISIHTVDVFRNKGVQIGTTKSLSGHQGHLLKITLPELFKPGTVTVHDPPVRADPFADLFLSGSTPVTLPGIVSRPQVWPSGSRGSLSYSWDVEGYHFVQLNNWPGYSRDLPESFLSPGFKFTQSYDWLAQDLAQANARGLKSIINVHIAGGLTDNEDFRHSIAGKNVVGVFAGHTHDNKIDEQRILIIDPGLSPSVWDDRNIPVHTAGAGFIREFLVSNFQSDYYNVGAISASGGVPQFDPNVNAKTFSFNAHAAPDTEEITSTEILWIDPRKNDSPSYFPRDQTLKIVPESVQIVSTSGLSISPNPAGIVQAGQSLVTFNPGSQFGELGEGDSADAVIRYEVIDRAGTTSESTITVTVQGRSVAAVTNWNDAGPGSLRQAIFDANSADAIETILFSDAFNTARTITLDSQLPNITDDLTIKGPGAHLLTIDAQFGTDGKPATGDGYRIFNVNDGDSDSQSVVKISGLRLTGGDVRSDDNLGRGGAITNREDLTLDDVWVVANQAYDGGGIDNSAGGHLSVVESAVHANWAHAFPGGGGGFGGGIFNSSDASIAISNSTLSGNIGVSGAAIASYGEIAVSSATVTQNTALDGVSVGGILAGGSESRVIQNTILSGNSPNNLSGAVVTGDNNLVGNGNAISGSSNQTTDSPGLSAIWSNGGHTRTHAIQEGSPALDTGLQRSALITPVSVTSSTSASDAGPASNLIDGSGIPQTLTEQNYTSQAHFYANSGNSWETKRVWIGDYFDSEPIPVLTFDLGGLHEVGEMVVWALLQSSPYPNQAKSFEVSFSTDGGVTFHHREHVTSDLVTHRGQTTLPFQTPRVANAIRVRVMDNQGRSTSVGISEVRFHASRFDQRGLGFDREKGLRRDIGAFELQNQSPRFASPDTATLSENTLFVGNLVATDVDATDRHTFAIDENGADSDKFQIVGGNRLSFIEAPDYEQPTDRGGVANDNVYEVKLIVTDSGGKTDMQTMFVTVTDLVDEIAPKLFSINRYAPLTEITNADTLVFRAEFDEQVQGIGTGDFMVGSGTTAQITQIDAVQGTGEVVYLLTVSGGSLQSHNGIVWIYLASNAIITDLAGNPLANSTPVINETYVVDNAAPQKAGLVVGDGGTGRSSVRSITVSFDTPVAFEAAAFDIKRTDGTDVNVDTNVAPGTLTDQVMLTFPGTIGGSLADGDYLLTIDDAHLRDEAGNSFDGDGDFASGGQSVDSFFRFFGDTDGDRDVDGQDYGRFGLTFLKYSGMAGFNPDFDFDGDGDVDGQDYGRFGLNFLKQI